MTNIIQGVTKNLNLDLAACGNTDTEVFFPAEGDRTTVLAAKKICHSCPIEAECLAYALANREYGIWGGTTESDRDRMRSLAKANKRSITIRSNKP
jgi:WhiB family redox-sensing transcriptional regulator